MNTGNDNHPSHTRGWDRMLSLKGVPRSLPRSGVPQTSDAKCGVPRALKSSSLRLLARGCCTLCGSPYGNHGQGRDVYVWCKGLSTVLETRHKRIVELGV